MLYVQGTRYLEGLDPAPLIIKIYMKLVLCREWSN